MIFILHIHSNTNSQLVFQVEKRIQNRETIQILEKLFLRCFLFFENLPDFLIRLESKMSGPTEYHFCFTLFCQVYAAAAKVRENPRGAKTDIRLQTATD